MTVEILTLLIMLLFVGLFAGFIGGLFGIGGGIVIVPAIYAVLGFLDVSDDLRIKIAVGSSLATIIMTSWRSVATHHKHGAVDVSLLKLWAPWIALGAIMGAILARFLEAGTLTLIFAIGAMLVALRKIFTAQKTAEHSNGKIMTIPANWVRVSLSMGIGIASSLMGIGGGVLGVIILTHLGKTIHQAIATASGFGLAIAIPATLGFMIAGWGQEELPFATLGYISLPAVIAIGSMTVITAPIGANIAHKLDQTILNRIFAAYLMLTAILMLWDVIV